MFRRLTAAAVLATACCTTLPAFSQDYPADRAMRQGQMNTLQSTFNSTTILDDTSDVASQQLESLRAFYKLAERSCVDVLATVADTCEIYRMTTTVNVMETGAKGRRLTVNGSIVMKVDFKKNAGAPAK